MTEAAVSQLRLQRQDWDYQRGKILFLCRNPNELYSLDDFKPPRGTDVLAITTFRHNHALPRGIHCDVVPHVGFGVGARGWAVDVLTSLSFSLPSSLPPSLPPSLHPPVPLPTPLHNRPEQRPLSPPHWAAMAASGSGLGCGTRGCSPSPSASSPVDKRQDCLEHYVLY